MVLNPVGLLPHDPSKPKTGTQRKRLVRVTQLLFLFFLYIHSCFSQLLIILFQQIPQSVSRLMQALSWGKFRRILVRTAAINGSKVIFCQESYTSQVHCCLYKGTKWSGTTRTCKGCNIKYDRDVDSSITILLKVVGTKNGSQLSD
jgi:transposase